MNIFKKAFERGSGPLFNIFAIVASFVTYTSMYGFRKPFSVALFAGQVDFLGASIDYKVLFILAQVFGYTASKFFGIKFVSETTADARCKKILWCIAIAELSLLGFAFAPWNVKFIFLILNGFPLGMIWGLVVGQLEGRRSTELLAAGLSISFILASGIVKSIGRKFLLLGVDEPMMPFVTGLICVPTLLLGVYMLGKIPKPNKEDEAARTKRVPMGYRERKLFFMKYAPGLTILTIFYMLLTALRDLRDNYSREIFEELGLASSSTIFTATELPIAIVVLVIMGMIMFIKDNYRALRVVYLVILCASALIGLSSILLTLNLISGTLWMILLGMGLFLAYVPFNSVLFDRIIAHTKELGTAGFLIYVADSFGYLSSAGVLVYKNLFSVQNSWITFIVELSFAVSVLGIFACLFSFWYFGKEETNYYSPRAMIDRRVLNRSWPKTS